jgi:hypothetical protein
LTLQFRNIPEIVQGEGVVRIKEIGLVENRFGFLVVVLFFSLYALLVNTLHGSHMATFGDSNLDVAGAGAGYPSRGDGNDAGNNPWLPGHPSNLSQMAELKHTYDALKRKLFVADVFNFRKIATTLNTRIGIQMLRQEQRLRGAR